MCFFQISFIDLSPLRVFYLVKQKKGQPILETDQQNNHNVNPKFADR